MDSLKYALGILKWGHRIEIKEAIERLYPNALREVIRVENEIMDKNKSSKCDSVQGTEFGKIDEQLAQIFKAQIFKPYSYFERKTNQHDFPSSSVRRTFARQAATGTSPEVISRIRKKSPRARPDNPTEYKTLRKTKIRAGRSAHTDIIGHISKGSVVLINQIKGRSGRIVDPQPDGRYTKVGWVTLYTHNRQQILEKVGYERKAEDRRMIIRTE